MFRFVLAAALAVPQAPEAELRVVEYLKAHIQPGEPVVVSRLYNEVFKTHEERLVLDRLFNSFFKLPLFMAQQQQGTGRPPTLAAIEEQFHFRAPGAADVLLQIMESDPRMPRFITRDPATGEVTSVDVQKILAHPRFGKALERTIAGWEGRPAPAFEVKGYDGVTLSSASLAGKPYLLYFWFTNCPPCVRSSPLLAELDRAYSSKGFRIIGLNADHVLELPYSDAERAAYARKNGLDFTLAYMTSEVQEAYGTVSVFPTLFFVDAKGTIVKQFVNFQEKAVLEDALRLALQ